MRKRMLPLVMASVLMFSVAISAAAAERAITGRPGLTISGTTAYCVGKYNSGNQSDTISMTLTLKLGTTTIDSWSASGTGSAVISETCTVQKGKTYTLVLSGTVNGVKQPDVSVTAKS